MKTYQLIVSVWMFVMCSCFKEDDYINTAPNAKIIITTDQTTLFPADGVSSVPIAVSISSDAAPERRKVVFRSTLGTFNNGTADSIVVLAGPDFKAAASLSSTSAGKAHVSVSVFGVPAADSPYINFTKAFPTKIKVSVDSFQIYTSYSSYAVITASLSTDNGGKPSAGHRVDFKVKDTNGADVGSFLNNISFSTTNGAGKATVNYSAGTGHAPGFLTIIASTIKADNSTEQNTTQIYLSDH